MKRYWLAAACLTINVAVVYPAAAAVAVSDDPVLFWNQVLLGSIAGNPLTNSRGYAMVDVAVHDAVNATVGSTNRSYLSNVATSGGDTRAAASKAAYDVLMHLNPDVPANAGRRTQIQQAYQDSLALVPDGAAKANGLATGSAVAAAAIINRANDGSTAFVPYSPSGQPGDWAPTGSGPAALPHWAAVNPWMLASGSQFRPDAPPALNSDQYTAAFNEAMAIGSAGSLTRTADQTASAQYWASPGGTGTGAWIDAAITASKDLNLSSLEYASMFGLLTTSVADALIGVWDTKYTYDYWRPVTAIRLADLDGNPDTIADPNWTPLVVTPNHPSYISGHAAIDGAASTALSHVLGQDADACFSGFRCFDSFGLAAENGANARLWGGIHWRFDNETGLKLGGSVANYGISQRFFAAVPEPSTWAMMILGFGLIGFAERRSRKAAAQYRLS